MDTLIYMAFTFISLAIAAYILDCDDEQEDNYYNDVMEDQIMNLEVGFEVYWNDPDEHVCSGYGTIVKIKGDIYCLKMDNGEEVEAFKHELS